jgi:2-dehydro-3-deoxygluconokinase
MTRVVCFGELLLRLSPQLGGEWIRQSGMPVFVGGAELNAATALAKWKVPVSYCTAIPDHYLSQEIMTHLSSKGIDTSAVELSGNRIGTYYLPQGADLKNAGVIYDRAYSSFWDLEPGQVDWDTVLQDASWFHFSAISPALNQRAAAVCREAVKAAAQKGITISVDLNYRSKLWQWGKLPHEVMPELVEHCHVVMGNIWAAENMLSIPLPGNFDKEDKNACLAASQATSLAIMKAFPNCKQVANTFRFDAGEGVRYYATLFDGTGLWVAPEQQTSYIIDKVGSGDTFMAGLIFGNYHHLPPQQVIDFAAAAAFNKLFIKGDATTASVEEIKKAFLQHG